LNECKWNNDECGDLMLGLWIIGGLLTLSVIGMILTAFIPFKNKK